MQYSYVGSERTNMDTHPKIINEIKSFGIYCSKKCVYRDKDLCEIFNKEVCIYKCNECLKYVDIGNYN